MRQLKPEFIEMVASMTHMQGGEIFSDLINALQTTEPSMAIRLNNRKMPVNHISRRPVPWAVNGFYIDGDRPRFTFDPAMHQGLYYVQDPSSMVIGEIVRQLTDASQPIVYIDACAAPGGKTTAAIDVLPEGSLVIANEFEYSRSAILAENLTKWGYPSVIVTNSDTSRFRRIREVADIIAVDVPCSGEGMMRKDDEAANQWSPGLVESCARLQREIVANAWEALRPGGYLIYSTCTFNLTEDEDNLRFIIDELGGESVQVDLPRGVGISGTVNSDAHAYRFIPGRCDGEGLFIGVIRKPGSSSRLEGPKNAKKGPSPTKQHHTQLLNWISGIGYSLEASGESIFAVPLKWKDLIGFIGKNLNVIYAGVEIATLKGRDYIPTQTLAMSEILNRAAFHNHEVDYTTAIAYLRRETIVIPDDAPKGFVLLTYNGLPLGFVKNLGNRANNLYPTPWAIRSSHIPEIAPQIIQS